MSATKDSLLALLPQALEAEQALLCAILLDNDALAVAAGIVIPFDFTDRRHQVIFEAMLTLYVQGECIDLLTLRGELERRHEYNRIGGPSVLVNLLDVVPTAEYVKFHADLIRKKAVMRKLIQMFVCLSARCYQPDDDVVTILNDTQASIRALRAYLPDEEHDG